MKAHLKREERSKSINDRNEDLLKKIYKIFTRKRPSEKGFDAKGRPHRVAEYGECSLNRRIRMRETSEINEKNQKILTKLQNVKAKVLTKEQWKENNRTLDRMQDYMTHYKNYRSYSRPRSNCSTASGVARRRNQSIDYSNVSYMSSNKKIRT